jgi:hypothetical protein
VCVCVCVCVCVLCEDVLAGWYLGVPHRLSTDNLPSGFWHCDDVPISTREASDMRCGSHQALQRLVTCAVSCHDVCVLPRWLPVRGGDHAKHEYSLLRHAHCVCSGDPANLTQVENDLANFLLVRGPHAWLGHGWLGCSHKYEYPAVLNADYGEPTELCHEVNTHLRGWFWRCIVCGVHTRRSGVCRR